MSSPTVTGRVRSSSSSELVATAVATWRPSRLACSAPTPGMASVSARFHAVLGSGPDAVSMSPGEAPGEVLH
jgi:hypothetical protein